MIHSVYSWIVWYLSLFSFILISLVFLFLSLNFLCIAFVQHPYLNVGLLYLTKPFQVTFERRPFNKLYGNCRLILYIVSQNVQNISSTQNRAMWKIKIKNKNSFIWFRHYYWNQQLNFIHPLQLLLGNIWSYSVMYICISC